MNNTVTTAKKALFGMPPARVDKTMEVVVSIVLSFASLLTAWNGYQASQWSQVQGRNNNQNISLRVQASQSTAIATQQQQVDVSVFIAWLQATNANDQRLADFYRARFRAEFKPAFEEWVASRPLSNTNAAATPFELPAYAPAKFKQAETLEQQAGEAQARGQQAGETVARYVIATLFVAASLFFAGISRSFNYRSVRLVLVAASMFLFLAGLLNSIGLPKVL
jgi:hypothetical protein